MTNWRICRIGDIGSVITGKTPSSSSPHHFGNSVPFVTPTDFDQYHKYVRSSERYLSRTGAEALRSKILRPRTVIVTCIGSQMGKVAFVDIECVTNQQINAIVCDEQKADPHFVYYSMRLLHPVLRRMAADGTTMPIINKGDFENLELSLPPLPIQRCIAEILGRLDDKIEVNRRISRTLERMAQALYKHWFVDFEPFQDGEFVESEMGLVPKGWSIRKLGDVASVVSGRSYKSSELSESPIALVTLKSFERGGGYKRDGLKGFIGPFKDAQVTRPGEVVIACTDITQNADVIGKPAIVQPDKRFSTLVASLDCLIVRPTTVGLKPAFLYLLFSTSEFQAYARAHSNGSTVLHLQKSVIPEYQLSIRLNFW